MAGLGMVLAGAARGYGDNIVEQARARRDAALRAEERQQTRDWQVEDRDLNYQRGLDAENRGFAREDAATGRAAGALEGLYGTDLLGLIDATEGGADYDTLFGHSQRDGSPFAGMRVSEMTIAELSEFASPSGEYGQWVRQNNPEGVVATPMGRYQIVGTTLRNAAAELGLDPNTPFSPEVQDRIAAHLAERRLASAGSIEGKREALRNEWAGFRNVPDATLDAAIRQYEAGDGAWTAAAESSGTTQQAILGGLVPGQARADAQNGTSVAWTRNADGTMETETWIVNGERVPILVNGQENTRPIVTEPPKLSASMVNDVQELPGVQDPSSSRLDPRPDPQLVATVSDEMLRLMSEDRMSENQAYNAVARAMRVQEYEISPATGQNWFRDGPAKPAEMGRRIVFDYGDSGPDAPAALPEPASMPSEPSTGRGLDPTPVSSPQANGLPQPKTQAEMMALPPGTRYMAPDGTIRTRQ